MSTFQIAIDGPAGAGKSTIARTLAGRLGYTYVDTGAMYRAMALYFLRKKINAKDERAIEKACQEIRIHICYQDGAQQVLLNEEDVTAQIREEQVGNMASATSGYLPVREKLLELQRRLAESTDVIMDGRDIGTCVLPDAQVKIYLTAGSRVRAQRRFKELEEKGMPCSLDEIEQDIIKRDRQDMEREYAPLRQAEDAALVDSSDMTLQQVVDVILDIVNSHLAGR